MDSPPARPLAHRYARGKGFPLPGSARVVTVFSALLVAVVWASVAMQLVAEREATIANAREQSASLTRVFEEHVRRTVRAAELALRHVEQEYRERGARLDLPDFVHEHGTLLEPYTIFSIVDARGDLILASYPFRPTNYADRESFRHHAANDTGKLYVSRPQTGTITGKSSVYLSRRLNRADGSFAGVAAVGLDTAYFSSFYDQVNLGPDAVVALIGLDGIVRARKKNDDETAGHDLSDFASFRGLLGSRAGNFRSERTLDGVVRIFAYRVMEDYPLVVQVGLSESEVLRPYRRMRTQLVAWGALVTGLVVLFAVLVAGQSARQTRYARVLAGSEARYRSFVNATSRVVWSADGAGEAREDSPSWRAYTGQSYDAYRGAGWLEAVHPDDRERTAAAWRAAITGGGACNAEFRLRGADGAYRVFRCRAAPVPGENGRVREWIAVLDDLTEMKEAEAALRASEARLRAIWEAEPECVALLDARGIVLDVNPAGLAMLEEKQPDDARGQPLARYVAADDRVVLEESVASVFRGEARSLTFELAGRAGTRRWMDMHCVPLRDTRGGEILALLGVARDITEEKRARDDLVASRRRQQDILHAIYAFVGLFTLDGVLVEANDAPFATTGAALAKAVGRPFWNAYAWSYSDRVQERLKAAMARAAAGDVVRYDEVLRAAPDRFVTVDIQFGPVRDEEGRVAQIAGFAVDITERRRTEAERAHLAHIVQASDDAIISRTLDHVIVSWNGGAERLFGYTADEVVGREMSMLIAPECQARYLRLRATPANGRCPPPHENTCVAKDGRRVDVWVSISPIHGERAELVGMSVILRDITEQKRLAAQQRLAASVLESAAEGIVIIDRDRNIAAVNPAFTEITGFTAEDAVGKDQRLLSSAVHPSSAYESVWQAVNATGRWLGEIWDRRKSGELYCALLSVTAVRDDDGVVMHYCAILMDVTQRKSAEADLQRLNAELEERVAARTRQLESANQELASFSYSVSHDLRAPVRAIEGFSALVIARAASQLDGETLNRLQRIRDNAQRMGLLIDDLLRLSRVSQRELDRRDFDLTALASSVVVNLRRADPQRQVEIAVAPGMTTNGDRALVQLVLENLVGNAWKFTERTEGARIEVGEQPGGSRPVYYVRDNGAGFDMQYADKLFKAFQRLHHREEFEGTGIGLSIVHRVVVKHGGRVWAEARVGEGATFFFTLG